MRRDMNLIRLILMRIEDLNSQSTIYSIFPEHVQSYKVKSGCEEQMSLVEQHFQLLVKSGFVESDTTLINIHGLTWEGHNLIDELRDRQL